jgi:putative ABC transport system permease protein
MIPISGMIASNSMVAIGLAYRSLNSQFHDQRQGVLERLALGADLLDASIAIVREAIRTGMSPTIDSAKTVGLVSLPGMMSGLISMQVLFSVLQSGGSDMVWNGFTV